jgi:hypothetical protein
MLFKLYRTVTPYVVILGILALLMGGCAKRPVPVTISSFTLNGQVTPLVPADYNVKNNIVYFAQAAFEKNFGLTVKEITPDQELGIYKGDVERLKVKIGTDAMTAYKENMVYYLPVNHILVTLGDTVVWDPVTTVLTVTIAAPPDTTKPAEVTPPAPVKK